MAMIDYGAVVIKNGRVVNENQFFQNMKEAVGWEDHPGLRYPHCDHADDEGHSQCWDCPRAFTEFHHHEILGDWENKYADCNGVHFDSFMHTIRGNYYAYIGDEELTLCFYKYKVAIVTSRTTRTDVGVVSEDDFWCGYDFSKSLKLIINDAVIHIHPAVKSGKDIWHCEMSYKGDYYHVIFGYGIDPNFDIWNESKYRYVGKKNADRIDSLYQRYITDRR